jgi:hypothetical protein
MDDDEATSARTRRRGIPVCNVLSDVFSELVLFCLDVAVNQATSGSLLWRMRDDVWFWSADHQTCVRAWQTLTNFASVTGTALDPGKTGSARIVDPASDMAPRCDPALPEGDIHWGFLKLLP